MAFNHILFLLLVPLIGITEIVNDSGLIYPLVAYHWVSDVFPVRAKCRAKGKGSGKTLMHHMGTLMYHMATLMYHMATLMYHMGT